MRTFNQLIARLKQHYGASETPPAKGPFELVLWENACYLLPDERRLEVFEAVRALKVWFTLKVYGTEALGASISRCCALARYLEARVRETPELELMAPVELNIVCFRYRAEDTNRVNDAIVVALQESGIVAPSTTRINGQTAIRAAIVNHRTSRAEIDALVEGALALGCTL
jgi:glutamate/tyrosine decarboxylase-like PLP-dependent enzyme